MKEFDLPKMTLLGVTIRRTREEKVWSMGELAKAAGVEKSIISRLESGEQRTAHRDNLEAIAGALDIPLEVLIELGAHPAAPRPDGLPPLGRRRETPPPTERTLSQESLDEIRRSLDSVLQELSALQKRKPRSVESRLHSRCEELRLKLSEVSDSLNSR